MLKTLPDRHRLSEHALLKAFDSAAILLFWRRGAASPNIAALREVLAEQSS